MRNEDLHAWLERHPPDARPIVLALREVVRRAAPDAEETIVWGCLSYHRPEIGGRVKGAVCQIVVRSGKVRLDFVHGVRLKSPLLRGTGVAKRYVPIESEADAKRREISALVRASGK